jgi:hypothetical protein
MASPGDFQIRNATLDDKAELVELIARSARELSAGDYTPAQVEGALRGAFGVDTQLITDRTYFVAEADGKLVACGGWSKRRTLFGSDARSGRDAAELDPAVDAAKIRVRSRRSRFPPLRNDGHAARRSPVRAIRLHWHRARALRSSARRDHRIHSNEKRTSDR